MAKKYDISKSSDMRRLTRDLENAVRDQAVQAAQTMEYAVKCPHCHSSVTVTPGYSRCPQCGGAINLELDIHF